MKIYRSLKKDLFKSTLEEFVEFVVDHVDGG